ncbi:hypothetical protein MKW92_046683 [Papaver armeniacum]|nr:hypothetical protein MKW92_046683 [Papaver armeniacum]
MVETKRRKLNYYHQNPNKIHVGKSMLIKALKKNRIDQIHGQIRDPSTIVSGNRRLIQFVECPNNMNGMIDTAKYADAGILLVDANYGFEMVHIAGVDPLADVTLSAYPIRLPPVDGNDKQMQINIEEPHLEIESFRRGAYQMFSKAPFRILATADVLKFNHTAKIVERNKRIGTPCLILNETALIKDMFTSDDEVDRFRDVKINTAHGIRGKINEAAEKSELPISLRWNDGQPREGIAKCTFDYSICMSDTIHPCEWTQIEVPCIFNPLTTPLEPSNLVWQDSVDKRQKAPFRILATVDELKSYRTAKIVERIKRIGTPFLTMNEAALTKDMFTSDDEVDRFKDVKIKTANGIQGKINEVHIAGVGDYPLADVTLSADLCPLPPVDGNDKQINIEHNNVDEEPQLEIEMVPNHDPCQPILFGGISRAEDNVGHTQEPVPILGTANVLDFNPTAKITDDVIKDMFTSDDEVNRFKDVKIKTVNGIQGKINEVMGAYNGTTTIAVINKTGLYFIVDGLSYLLIDTDTAEKRRNITRDKPHKVNCPKLFQLGKEMLASVQGSNFWSNHIFDVLRPKVEGNKSEWLPKKCAEETQKILKEHVFTEDDLVKEGFPKDYDMSKVGCGIVFGAYIEDQEKGRVPSMYYADRDNCLEVIDADRYNGTIAEINDDDKIRVGYICGGSGGVKAESELLLYFSYQQTPDDKLDRECLTIENGNLSKDEHTYVLFRAMRGG